MSPMKRRRCDDDDDDSDYSGPTPWPRALWEEGVHEDEAWNIFGAVEYDRRRMELHDRDVGRPNPWIEMSKQHWRWKWRCLGDFDN